MQISNHGIMIIGFLCLVLMTSCAKEDFINETNEAMLNTHYLADSNTERNKGGGDNDIENNPDVVVTVNDADNIPKIDYLVVMSHNNNGTNGNGNGNNGNGNGNNGNGNPVYNALTTSSGVALLSNIETGNYTLEVYDEDANLVYTTSTSITEDREEIQIIIGKH